MINSEFIDEVDKMGLAAEVTDASIRVVEPDTESDAQRTLLEVFKTQRYSFSTYPALENTPRAADLYAAACSLAGTPIHERGGRKYVVRLNAGLYLKGENTFTEDANAAEVFWTAPVAQEVADTTAGCWVDIL